MDNNIEFAPVQHSPFSKVVKIKLLLWRIVNITVFKWSPFFCRKFRVFLLKCFGAKIDWSCSIDRLVEIDGPWFLTMGKQSRLTDYAWLRCRAPVVIGRNVCVGRGVRIMTGSHDVASPDFRLVTAPVTIADNAWIATQAFIQKGITIGEGAVVAACAVVIKDVAPWSIVGGNPARFIKERKLIAVN